MSGLPLGELHPGRLTAYPVRDAALEDPYDALPIAFFGVDAAGRVAVASDRFCALVGFPRGALLGSRAPFPFWPEESHDELSAALAAIGSERHGTIRECFYRRADGARFPVRCDVKLGNDRGGGPELLVVVEDMSLVTHDVDRLHEAYAAAGLSSWSYYPGRDLLVHPTGLKGLTGLAVDGATLQQVLAALAEPGRSWCADTISRLVAGGLDHASQEVELQRAGYRGRWVQLTMQAVRNPGTVTAHRILGTSRDVTAQRQAAVELERGEERLRRACRAAKLGSFESDHRSGIVTWSRELLDLIGAPASAPLRQHRADVARTTLGGHVPDVAAQAVGATQRDGKRRKVEYTVEVRGESRRFEGSFEPMEADGVRVGVSGVVRDISDQHESNRVLQLQEQLLDALDVSIITTDLQRRVTSWNNGAARLHGWTAEEMRGTISTDSLVVHDPVVMDEVQEALDRDGSWAGELLANTKSGATVPVFVRHKVLFDAAGEPLGTGAVGVDISERVRHERELRTSADRFQKIADSIGDGLVTLDEQGRVDYINPVAEELLGWRSAEVIGTDFAVVVRAGHEDADPGMGGSALPQVHDGGHIVRRPDETFVRRDGTDLPVTVTEAAFETGGGERGSVLVFRDNSARRAAESQWRAQMEQLTWAGRLRSALQEQRFELYAQPIVDLRTHETVQRELLLRLNDEDGTVVTPGCFLPAAEEYGFMLEIDRWVALRSVEIAAAGIPVEFNLSAQSLSSRGFITDFEQQLRTRGVDPGLIVVEVTETALISDEGAAEDFIERVKALGCKVALDDFGTGYGGFSYLKRLPVDYLKIDREFVADLRENDASMHVVKAVVNLAQGFGQRTIAEGVEDAETLSKLRELGVDHAQGYFLGRPAPLRLDHGADA